MRAGVYWITRARLRVYVCAYITQWERGGRGELCSLSANGLWHLLEVRWGALQNYELPVAVRGTLTFSFLRPLNGRSLSADTSWSVLKNLLPTERDDGTSNDYGG